MACRLAQPNTAMEPTIGAPWFRRGKGDGLRRLRLIARPFGGSRVVL